MTDTHQANDRLCGAIINATSEGFWMINTDLVTVDVNNALCQMLGYQPQEMLGKQPFDFVDKENEAVFRHQTANIPHQEHRSYEINLRAKDGSMIPTIFNASTLRDREGNILGGVAFVTNITNIRKMADSFRQTNQLLELIRHIQSQFILSAEPNKLFTEILNNLLSLTESEYGFIGEVLQTDQGQLYIRTFAIMSAVWTQEIKDYYNDKSPKAIEFSNLNSLYGRVLTTGQAVISNAPLTDPYSGGLPDGHPPIKSFLGMPFYGGNTVVGMVGIANKPGGYTDEHVGFLQPLLSTCGNIIMAYKGEQLRRRIENSLTIKTQQLEELNAHLEERVRLEIQRRGQQEVMLIHQSKLAAMGDMIGAIAHQWRQPLNAIGMIIQDFEDAFTFGELNKDYIDTNIKRGMEIIYDMSKTIDDFRNFFRADREMIDFDLISTVQKVISLVSDQLRHNYISVTVNSNGLARLITSGLPNEFKQVMLNVIGNARDAILQRREKGHMGKEKGLISIEASKEAGRALLRISDNGGGIGEKVIDRIFEPYFTTKQPDKGTGIGLHMSKIIIEEHMSGYITVANITNGAMFTIELNCKESV
ncbi:sensor signal transduction histidine kinase [Candidatus Magnetobacterium bavaricum]|uniref:histidine kinase n=1 Tax=Candidatus Magnetobacterium bavaricum TaxID=29290 RepID=A0A0F3GRW4_9BACT|nr:sensor signal transduction histidine kinase [Candidatus Magnetobacterium bavaricum]